MKKLLTVLCLILLLFAIMPIGAEETESAANSNEKNSESKNNNSSDEDEGIELLKNIFLQVKVLLKVIQIKSVTKLPMQS